MRKLLIIAVLFLSCSFVYAQEIISDFSKRSVPILNEELRRLKESIVTVDTLMFCQPDGTNCPAAGGDLTDVGDCSTGACFTNSSGTGTQLYFKNATSGSVTLNTVTGALGTRTISLPAETGTVCTTGSLCSGYGDVVGPSSSSDNEIPRYHLTSGKIIQTSGLFIDDNYILRLPFNTAGSVGGIFLSANSNPLNASGVFLQNLGSSGTSNLIVYNNLYTYNNLTVGYDSSSLNGINIQGAGLVSITASIGAGADDPNISFRSDRLIAQDSNLIANEHFVFAGTSPAGDTGSCGGGGYSIATSSRDQSGEIIMDVTTSVTACQITFGKSFGTDPAPNCVCKNVNKKRYEYCNATATVLTIGDSSSEISGDTVEWNCSAYRATS